MKERQRDRKEQEEVIIKRKYDLGKNREGVREGERER